MGKQVDRAHYAFGRYGHVGRFASYHYQLREVLALNPSSVLEVGVGDGVFGCYLKNQTAIRYTALDVAEDLHPDVVGDIKDMPCADGSHDVVCAFQVLEHLPWEEVPRALAEMARVTRTHVVLSVPHFAPQLKFLLKIPLVPELRVAVKIPFPRTHRFDGEHYWELGKRGYPVRRFRALLGRYGSITREFVPFEYQYHWFFVLEKKKKQ